LSRLFNIALLFAVVAGLARADFVHSFVTPGEVYTNTMTLDLYYGRYERTDAIFWIGEYTNTFGRGPDLLESFQCYAGSTNDSDGTAWPSYDTVTRTNEYCLLPFAHAGYTNLPHVRQSVVHALDDYSYPIDDDNDIYGWLTAFYVRHWDADGNGLFDSYLQATSGPALPLINDPGVILSYTNAGYVANEQYDVAGNVTNSWWAFTRSPAITQAWNLADLRVGSTNWVFQENTSLDFNQLDSGLLPDLEFQSGGHAGAVSISATITGLVFSSASGTRDPFSHTPSSPLLQDTVADSETVTLTTNGAALTKRWHQVTGISAASLPANTGHTWSVVYRGEFPLYGDRAWTMRASDHNERRSVIDGLRWTYSEPWTGVNPNLNDLGSTQLTWTASSTQSWADAKAKCALDTPAKVTGHERAQQWTSGSFNPAIGPIGTWTANARASRAKRRAGDAVPMTPNMEYKLDFYSRAIIPNYTNVEHYTYNATWMTSTGLFYGVSAITTATGNVWAGYGGDAGWFGSTSRPTVWCAEPTDGVTTFRGYEMDNETWTVLKWDATTNGLNYKR